MKFLWIHHFYIYFIAILDQKLMDKDGTRYLSSGLYQILAYIFFIIMLM